MRKIEYKSRCCNAKVMRYPFGNVIPLEFPWEDWSDEEWGCTECGKPCSVKSAPAASEAEKKKAGEKVGEELDIEKEEIKMLWTDLGILNKDCRSLLEENERQLKKWGRQTRTPFEWLAYLTEEVGELAKAISEVIYRNGALESVSREAVQVSALALKIAVMADCNKDTGIRQKNQGKKHEGNQA